MVPDEEFVQQLRALKVPDLRYIAAQCQLKTTGKKAELVERLGDPQIAAQAAQVIQKMARGLFAPPQDPPSAMRKRRLVETPASTCICKGTPGELGGGGGDTIGCPRCGTAYHAPCVGLRAGAGAVTVGPASLVAGAPVSASPLVPRGWLCPVCRLNALDPFYPVAKVLHLLPLFDGTESGAEECKRVMPLQSPNIHDLRRKGCEVTIVCLRLNHWPNLLLHEWPLTLTVTINQNIEKIKEPEYEHKRRDVPMKITPYLFGDTPNEIRVTARCSPTNVDPWVIAVVLNRPETIEHLQQAVVANQRLPFEEARAFLMENVRKFYTNDEDDEIDIVNTSSCKVRLSDPITLTRIEVPVRGRTCHHSQCFDLNAFLTVTKSTKAFGNRWKCVECNQFVRPKDLVIDSFFEHLLRISNATTDALVFDESGNWEEQATHLEAEADEDELGVKAATAAASQIKSEVIDVVDLLDEEEEGSEEVAAVPAQAAMPAQAPALERRRRPLTPEGDGRRQRARQESIVTVDDDEPTWTVDAGGSAGPPAALEESFAPYGAFAPAAEFGPASYASPGPGDGYVPPPPNFSMVSPVSESPTYFTAGALAPPPVAAPAPMTAPPPMAAPPPVNPYATLFPAPKSGAPTVLSSYERPHPYGAARWPPQRGRRPPLRPVNVTFGGRLFYPGTNFQQTQQQ